MDILDLGVRKEIIKEIDSDENKKRKAESLKQFEIFNDRQHQYVLEYLKQQFSDTTVKQMPIISSVNVAKRIVENEASIYKQKPERIYSNASDTDIETLEERYEEMNIDSKMLKANQIFKMQNQCLLMVIPKNGKLLMRVLWAHHYDVITDPENPEIALGYIVSSFNKSDYLKRQAEETNTGVQGIPKPYADGTNQSIADQDDYKESLGKYVVWTDQYNFVMDENGLILSEEIENPIGKMPFVDISVEKDFEYFVRQGQSLTDFSVQYNGALSDYGNIVRMQGWAQAVFKGPKELIPEQLAIGPNVILKLVTDGINAGDVDFKFVSPSPDLDGTNKYLETMLSNFLTSRGLDPKIVSSTKESQKFSSGIERLLSMIEKFEASKIDMELFRDAEYKVFDLVKAWNDVYEFSEAAPKLSENIDLDIKFYEPQMIQSRNEQLDSITKEMELGLKSRKQALMELYGVDSEKADELIEEIDEQFDTAQEEKQPEEMIVDKEA